MLDELEFGAAPARLRRRGTCSGEETVGVVMNFRESELVPKAIDGIARVFEQHQGGTFNATALRELDHHAYTVRIYTTDAICRQKLSYIQDLAAIYFSDRRPERDRSENISRVEFLGLEIKQAVASLRERFVEIRSSAAP